MWGPNAPYFGFWRGFWILDFGSWGFRILDFGDFGFWILDFGDFGDFGFWILGILDFGFWGCWILDFRDFGDFGFWIFGTLCSRSLCAKFWFWILGILDFGFWGFWILDFGDFLSLGDWGFWIWDFDQTFGCYIRKEDCARRPGSADNCNQKVSHLLGYNAHDTIFYGIIPWVHESQLQQSLDFGDILRQTWLNLQLFVGRPLELQGGSGRLRSFIPSAVEPILFTAKN